ncbi:MAG: Na/Pi cotransporter family protein, partial [Desulfobacteraceae bacterium]|nr:Na/Pi cotransporter family protein [Desulfobacteraceae bacterium]
MIPLPFKKADCHAPGRESRCASLFLQLAHKRYLWVPAFALMIFLIIPLVTFSRTSISDPESTPSSQVAEPTAPEGKRDLKGSEAPPGAKVSHKGEISVKATLFQVFGGLGLFLFGLHLMSDSLQKVVGGRMKRVLATLTKRPVYGLLLGTGVTAIIQSSSATTIMVVGFINAGVMDFVQSVGVILGANVGTTVTTQIVALKLDQWAFPAIGLGMTLHLFFKDSKVKDSGLILLGFGMLFLGLVLMKKAIPPEAQDIIRNLFLLSSGSLKGILIGLTVGTIATAIVQSSSVTVSIIVVLASQGMVAGLKEAIPLILGCNIGTCITALIASIGAGTDSKR